MYIYIIASLVIAALCALAKSRTMVRALSAVFVAFQIGFGVFIACNQFEAQSTMFFTFDHLGMMFYFVMAIIAALAFHISSDYLDKDELHQFKIYTISMLLLCTSSACLYFSNNVAVTWIFLEITTLCTAGLVYHKRGMKSLEATWKYIFVCSVGISMAYLGILIISSHAHGDISYLSLVDAVMSGDPFYMKVAFLLVMTGYSCKMEIFPLFTVGIDANYAAPTPASAVISTVLVNSGFVAMFRIVEIFRHSEIWSWCSNLLIVIGVLSVAIGALYIRRTNNYKRLLAYSTTENMGLVMIAMALGGIGTIAALIHVVVHSMIKGGMFTLISQIGKLYGSYRINRIGNYAKVNPMGAAAIFVGALSLTAFPPSGLFVSEVMLFSGLISERKWWLVAVIIALLCVVIYSILERIIQLCFRNNNIERVDTTKFSKLTTFGAVALIVVALAIGALQPALFTDYILSIVQ
ncbi:MAG: proton-conducting transporter membrane subunit [Rikenellaceae bacterium]